MWNKRCDFEENNYYHIYNRWFEKQIIFRNDYDFSKFYKYIIKNKKEYIDEIKIVSYCFLPNHFHFIFKINKTGLFLSDFMRKIQVSYAMYFKRKYTDNETIFNRPVFEWRFKSKLINSEEYLNKCLAYVNFNALKHDIVENINDYKWTSYNQIDKSKIEKYKDLELDELEL
jgi:REP element-mobilizing transposase RayT